MTISGDVTPYTDLIISQHAVQPNFMAVVAVRCQPYADMVAVAQAMPGMFDIDVAVGDQLDAVGEWVGITRYLTEPLTNVYLTLGPTGPGLGQGILMGPYDPTSGLVELPDQQYRTLLYARIAANHWDGTIPGAYAVLQQVFPDFTIIIQDNGNKSMLYGLVGSGTLDAATLALFLGGYFDLKPAGITIDGYVLPPPNGAPIFGLGANNATIGGLGSGYLSSSVAGRA